MSRKNYIYIDYENKKNIDLGRVAGKPVEVILAIGPQTKALPLVLVEQILKVQAQIRLLKSVTTGRNALDFCIATDLGEVKGRDPDGFFHILSGDKDFDSLKENQRAQGVLIERRESLSEIPILMDGKERLADLKQRLNGTKGNAPKSRESLAKYIQAQFNQSLSGQELKDAVEGLSRAGILEKTNEASGKKPNVSSGVETSVVAPPKSPKPLPGVGERVKMIRDALAKSPKNRPSKEAKLRTYIINLFHRDVPEAAMKKTLAELRAAKILEINASSQVSYPA